MAKLSLAHENLEPLHRAGAYGFPWQVLLGLLQRYGPLVLDSLTRILDVPGLTLQQRLEWLESDLLALATGQTEPPLPTPTR